MISGAKKKFFEGDQRSLVVVPVELWATCIFKVVQWPVGNCEQPNGLVMVVQHAGKSTGL